MILAGILAIAVVSISTDGGSALQTSSAELDTAGGAGGSNDGGGGATAGADTGAGEGELAAQAAEYGGTGASASEECELEGTVWDGGTVWP